MALSWNEIKSRALEFSQEWAGESSEDAEAKSFWDAFFRVFGLNRRRLASFEQAVKKIDGGTGFIDLFWEGTLIVEHKSKGKSLDKAFGQATDYFHGLKEHQLPKYILVSDFAKIRLYDLEQSSTEYHEFSLSKLVDNVHLFGFIAGYQKRTYKEQDPVNIEAAEKMGKLHDRLKEIGYAGHQLELYLVRLLFCLFSDDGGIFEKGIFTEYLSNKTNEDGSDLALHLAQFFQVLNTPKEKRLKTLDEDLNEFPYVNGKLFEEQLPMASFDSKMRDILLECCALDWGQISPAIFGSLFQSVMDEMARRNLGAHYTSEKNILKLIKPLFLDDLWAERAKAKGSKPRLQALHEKLGRMRFIDPACGCGNFLIVAYRELRLLELDILKELYPVGMNQLLDIEGILRINVDQFYGIEYEEFPSQIAQVAMWLIDHQMNMKVSEAFGLYYVRLPLTKAATIKHGNALRLDWAEVLNLKRDAQELSHLYILGNPPFVGAMVMSKPQREDIDVVFDNIKNAGVLDYVSAWFHKASELMSSGLSRYPSLLISSAFVSTSSITQGEQVGILWKELLEKFKITINFAHRTFRWSNEARGNAAVHCIIMGFACIEHQRKIIFDYSNISAEPMARVVKDINPYLVEASNILIRNRSKPLSDVPEMRFGNMPRDGGHFILSVAEREEILRKYPNASKFIRLYIGSQEFIRREKRYCLWLIGANPADIRQIPPIVQRIEQVRDFRSKSTAESTRKFASMPTLFCQIAQPNTDYLLIPSVSSENRKYIPIGYMNKETIVSNLAFSIADASEYYFGILSSEMHMAWVRYVAGRLESRYRYSKDIVYNNYPFPQGTTDKQIQAVEKAAQAVLDARALYPTSSLADLYDPNTMPPELVKAHNALEGV